MALRSCYSRWPMAARSNACCCATKHAARFASARKLAAVWAACFVPAGWKDWRDSADAFPIEYDDIRAAHRVLAGRDPWHGIRVDRNDVRRQLEHELMGKLVHLRQVYAAEWSKPKRLAEVVRGTWPGFLTMLRAVLRLAGRPAPATPEAVVRDAGALIGFATDGLTEPLAYLDAMGRTAEYVNRLERTPS